MVSSENPICPFCDRQMTPATVEPRITYVCDECSPEPEEVHSVDVEDLITRLGITAFNHGVLCDRGDDARWAERDYRCRLEDVLRAEFIRLTKENSKR